MPQILECVVQATLTPRSSLCPCLLTAPTDSHANTLDSRVTTFIGTLRRDNVNDDCTVVIVTHGLALRLFLMRWFQWTVEQFEATHNPPNWCPFPRPLPILKTHPGAHKMTVKCIVFLHQSVWLSLADPVRMQWDSCDDADGC
jgi:hypothetical protein